MPLASCLLPLAFPSWEGLGVGSSCLLPLACSLLPAPCSLKPRTLCLTQLRTAINESKLD
ncbi:MAG: hypothetical protein F6J90_36800 [Moorea sp. SIOASIH]|uniref:hypothetical protein n=1 Tax=Moorena sp. SIOASIH TaxID=2607817 RepID=UPI0013B72081|nr:hypothetical protein [Moorena sp. SIOASIH]NEO41591.1 hypothetical protein [Moorena sp. SIOASIH]